MSSFLLGAAGVMLVISLVCGALSGLAPWALALDAVTASVLTINVLFRWP